MIETPKVALLVETSRGFGRQFLSGVARYSQLHGPWHFFIKAGDFEQALPHMEKWGGTGIIARVATKRVAKAIAKSNLPTIILGTSDGQFSPENSQAKFSELGSNATDVARMAVQHFQERSLNHFAYVGLEGRIWSTRREHEFARLLEEAGKTPSIYSQPESPSRKEWDQEHMLLANWLKTLPKPVGLFACNDDRGREVLEACRIAELRVPDDVAVLGVDNDEVFCGLAYPPLSSIALNAESAGYRAAELLHSMMQGIANNPQRIEVEALGVVTRRSTDIVAVEDQDVADALRFIHGNKGYKITVDDVVQEVLVSRRYLEKRFKLKLERTILEEIQKARLEQAKNLLLETTFPISQVAHLAGFGTTGYFIHFFRKHVGKTPRKYRDDLNRY